MPFHIALAVLGLRAASLSRDEVTGLTHEEQIKKCHESEAEAQALAASKGPETREYYLRLANRWTRLAAEIERDHYLLR